MPTPASPDAIARVLQRLDLPEATSIAASPAPLDGIRIGFADHPAVDWLGGERTRSRGMRHARVGLQLARGRVPAPDKWWLVDGGTLLVAAPAGAPPKTDEAAVGAVRAALHAVSAIEAPHHGLLAGADRFWPAAASFADEIGQRLEAIEVDSRVAPLGRGLREFCTERLEAVEACTAFTLVHGNLTPRTCRVDDQGRLVSVTHWDRAHFGDPLQDWVRIALGPRALATELKPEGLDAAEISRLELYCGLRLLEQLTAADSPARTVARWEDVRHIGRALANGWIETWLSGEPPGRGRTPAIHQCTQTLALAAPGIEPGAADVVLGGLAAAVWSIKAHERGNSELSAQLARHVVAASKWADAAGGPLVEAPHPQRSLADELAQHPSPRGAALNWLCDQLPPQAVPAGVRAALSSLAPALATRFASELTGEQPAKVRNVRNVLLGPLMLASLEADHPDSQPILESIRASATSLELQLMLMQGYDTAVWPTVEALAAQPKIEGHQWIAFAVLLALDHLHQVHLPWMPPDAVTAFLGVGSA